MVFMSYSIEKIIKEKKGKNQKMFAWLIDPDKLSPDQLKTQLEIAVKNPPSLIFLGGSLMIKNQINQFISQIKSVLDLPVIIFPGSTNQVHENADGILFLSLISGRNPDFLIGRHVEVAYLLSQSNIEVLPTGYMLVDCGIPTTASYMSSTLPLPYHKNDIAVSTALAGEMLGLRFLFLDGGSGASKPVNPEMISMVSRSVKIPLLVGGGIVNTEQMEKAFRAGADVVVVGNIIEKHPELLINFASVANSFPL